MTLLNKILLAMMAIAVSAVAAINTYTFVHFAQEPINISLAQAMNSPVTLGDDVIIKYTATRDVLCKTDGDIFVLQEPSGLVVQSSRRPAGIVPLGTSTYEAHISTLGLRTGKYVARIFVHSDCGDRLHTIMVPDIPFEIVD
jgi:hypothetical protein